MFYMRTLYAGKFNVILMGVLVGFKKIQNFIWGTLYSHGSKNNVLLTHIYLHLRNAILPTVPLC